MRNAFLRGIEPAVRKVKVWEIQQKRRILFGDEWNDPARKDDWHQMIRDFPENAESYYRLGNAHFEEGEYSIAADYYSRALEIDPTYVDALRRRGDCYYILAPAIGERSLYFLKRALPDYVAALVLEKEVYTLNAVGLIYDLIGNGQTALRYYTDAIQQSPNYPESYFNRGSVFKKLGDRNRAISDLKKYLTLDTWHEQEVERAKKWLSELEDVS
jgi:tetratricopeptide (TPR) repeat protein